LRKRGQTTLFSACDPLIRRFPSGRGHEGLRRAVALFFNNLLEIFTNKGYKRYLGKDFRTLLQGSKRGIVVLLAVILVAGYGWMFFHGPQGFQSLIEKRRLIRELEERNATLRRENEQRKERIRRLQDSRSEQELEIRKQLKLQKPGETTFILPESEQKEKEVPSPE